MFLYRFVRWCRKLLFMRWLLNKFLYFFYFWQDCWPSPIDYQITFWSIFVVTLTLNDLDLELSRSNIEFAIYRSQKWSDCHETKKQTYRLNIRTHMWPSDLTLAIGHDRDLEFSRSNMEFVISQPKVVRLPWNEKQTYQVNSRPQMWPMGLTLAMTLTFEFSRSNMTFDRTHGLD